MKSKLSKIKTYSQNGTYNLKGLIKYHKKACRYNDPDSKVHGTNMGPTRVLLATDGSHVGPMNLAIRVTSYVGVEDLERFGTLGVLWQFIL